MIRVVLIALLLSGCAASQTVNTTDPAKAAFAAKSTYEGLLILAVAYNRRPPCVEPRVVLTCRDPAVVEQLRKASAAADAGTQAAENAVRMMGANPTIVSAAVAAAQQSVLAFKSITDTYGAK